MRRSLQFSLLGLLLLTAAIAVGVKLWHGPHHVVDRSAAKFEDEYTYTRDWTGLKIVSGPRVLRYLGKRDHIERVTLHVYRQGELLPYKQMIYAYSPQEQ